MRKILLTAVIAFMTIGSASAQSVDPWAGYQTRDIRQLRDEASARRNKLRDLAAEQHAARKGNSSKPAKERSAVRGKVVVLPVSEISETKRPTPRPAVEPVAWSNQPLIGSADERALYLHGIEPAYSRDRGMIGHSSRKVDGYVMSDTGSLRAEVSISRQRMRLLDGGEFIAEWPVSTGRPGFESSRGSFKVSFLSRNHKSRKYDDAPMPCSIFYNGGEAIHGTSDVKRLGKKASHGCVRLKTVNACSLYDMVAARGKSSLSVIVSE